MRTLPSQSRPIGAPGSDRSWRRAFDSSRRNRERTREGSRGGTQASRRGRVEVRTVASQRGSLDVLELTPPGVDFNGRLSDLSILTNARDQTDLGSVSVEPTLHVAWGRTWTLRADTLIRADEDIIIDGTLAYAAAVRVLVLRAGRDIHINGSVRPDPAARADVHPNRAGMSRIARGGDGCSGTVLLLHAGSRIVIHGTLTSGEGSPGQSATASSIRSARAIGGRGGDGGDIHLTAPSIGGRGLLLIGSGGSGGSARATAGFVGRRAYARGGDGGRGGSSYVTARCEPWQCGGGHGGRGGDAQAGVFATSTQPSERHNGSDCVAVAGRGGDGGQVIEPVWR